MSGKTFGAAAGIAVILFAAALHGAEVTGRVRVVERTGSSSTATIVYAESLDGRSPIHPVHRKLVQKDKTFVPSVLAISVGSTVDFPNQDPIFHNVFSLSRPEPFDLGLYRAGASKSRVFSEPATYRVFCNIHPQMTAVILVLPTSWIAETDASGSYHLDLPPGHYRVSAWSVKTQPATTEITVPAEGASVPDLSLNEGQYVELPHKNKYGQDYSQTSYDAQKVWKH